MEPNHTEIKQEPRIEMVQLPKAWVQAHDQSHHRMRRLLITLVGLIVMQLILSIVGIIAYQL